MYEYHTSGTCSKKINFELKDGRVYSISFEGGCNGNLKALSILLEGMEADEIIKKLKGLRCGKREASCADQLVTAIVKTIEQNK